MFWPFFNEPKLETLPPYSIIFKERERKKERKREREETETRWTNLCISLQNVSNDNFPESDVATKRSLPHSYRKKRSTHNNKFHSNQNKPKQWFPYKQSPQLTTAVKRVTHLRITCDTKFLIPGQYGKIFDGAKDRLITHRLHIPILVNNHQFNRCLLKSQMNKQEQHNMSSS